MAWDVRVVEVGWRMRSGYNVIRNFMRGFGEESSNLLAAIIELTIWLTFVVGILVMFKVCALFGALRW
jgi:hypothetical protein